MPLIAGQEGYTIICNSYYGPVFGRGGDLRIVNSPNSNNCTVKLNNTYQCPTGQNANTFLTGNQTFLVNEMEVFGFEQYGGRELPLKILKFVGIIFVTFFLILIYF